MHEVEVAYWRLRETMDRAQSSGDWSPMADLFAADAVLRRPGIPDCHGREEIRAYLVTSTATFPGSHVERVDVPWHAIDLDHRRVVHELRHVMRDPGDGVPHFALTTAMLRMGDDGLWSAIDDTFNPHAYRMMYRSWLRAAQLHGGLDVGPEVIEAMLVTLDARSDPDAAGRAAEPHQSSEASEPSARSGTP